jgi:hypothetical protein
MRPVALSVVEGKNFILGTFDTSGFQTWWKSLPFPGDVESIEDVTHIYGQYHACIVKLVNGTYSIYRTHDSGKTWKEVYNTSDIIYSITRINYGHVIASTSTGWLESTLDSGLTWTKISSFAPGCKTVINVSNDILFGHDGNHIWRSYDIGRTWSKVLSRTGWVSLPWHAAEYPDDIFYGSWDGDTYPALAGAGQTIYVGFGPYLNISDDLGDHWFTHLQGWTEYWAYEHGIKWGYGPDEYAWGGAQLFSPCYNTRILQLEMTDTAGTTPDDHVLMARVLTPPTLVSPPAIVPPILQRYVHYAYSGNKYFYETKSTGYAWKIKFTLPFVDEKQGGICSYDVLQPGSSEYNKLAMVCSYTTDNKPIVLHSNDAGWTWNTLNYNNVTVYEGDPTQEVISGIGQHTFDEEYWTTATWMGSACHNDGTWVVELNKTIRGLSNDMDLQTTFFKNKNYNMIYSTEVMENKEYIIDILCKKPLSKNLFPDILLKNSCIKNIIISPFIQKYLNKSYNISNILSQRKIINIPSNILIQQTNKAFYNIRLNQKDTAYKSCEFGIKLVEDHVDEIMTSINRYTPQAPDVRYPNIPYVPFDSRDQEVT